MMPATTCAFVVRFFLVVVVAAAAPGATTRPSRAPRRFDSPFAIDGVRARRAGCAKPNTGDNGVHASASPFEALAERMNWVSAVGAAWGGGGGARF